MKKKVENISVPAAVVMPEEVKNASQFVQNEYIKWKLKEAEIENHPLKYYTIPTKDGDPFVINCGGVYPMLKKQMERNTVATKEDYIEVRRRWELLTKLKMEKGAYARKWNGVLFKGDILTGRKGQLIEEFGKYKSIEQVNNIIKQEWGFQVSLPKLREFFEANLAEIKDRRARFVAESKDFYLTTETGRVESLSYLFDEIMKLFKETKNIKYSAEVRAIIEQVRKEIKGEEIRLTVDGKIDLTASIQANRTIQELNRIIPINLFVASLVAAKKGIEPTSIMAQLGNSFYNKWNGYNRPAEENEKVVLPSEFVQGYDWAEIEKKNNEKELTAGKTLFDNTLRTFLKKHGVSYEGDINKSMNRLREVLNSEVVQEIIDITPIQTEVKEEEKEKVMSNRDLLRKILKENQDKVK